MGPILDAIGTLPDAEIDLADAALQLARVDAPDADWLSARAHLSELARGAVQAAYDADGSDLAARAAALSDLLCDQFGYGGAVEDYDNPANANLLRVIERRRGLPVALGVLWLHAANAAGWPAYGVDVPGHFVIALADPPRRRRLVVDVFDGGKTLDDRAVLRLARRAAGSEPTGRALAPMTSRAVLVRLQSNIRLRRMDAGDLAGALACAEDTLRVAPEHALLWRETARLQEKLDLVASALRSYERFLALSPTDPAAERVRAAMEGLRARLN